MKNEHEQKINALARREQDAKKQVHFSFLIRSLFQSISFQITGDHLGTNVSRMDGNDGKTSQ